MADLRVKIAGVQFKNPIIAASGTYGFGRLYSDIYEPSRLGGISLKGITLEPREGNPPSRMAETPSGMLNSVGLQNPGVDVFINSELPELADLDTVLIANVAGSTIDDYIEVARRLNDTKIDMIELNISCPNVRHGGLAFGTTCESAAMITKAVKAVTNKPLIVKLSPNVTDIVSIAKAIESEGADGLALINTLLGMRIDIKTRRPLLKNNVGGLSGPAVFPVALRMVWQVAQNVKIPVIGLGGISTYKDAVEMMMAGASAVQIGTAIFSDPFAPVKIVDYLDSYLDGVGIKNVTELTGSVIPW